MREFDQLTDAEKDALQKLDAANRVPVPKTFDSTCALARELTDSPRLQARDDDAQLYNQLFREKWIVVRHYDQSSKMRLYDVSDEYRQLQLQLA